MVVYSLLKGRLGNILFEIATGASLAKRLGREFFAVYHYSGKEYLSSYENNVLRKVRFVEKLPLDYYLYKEQSFNYTEINIPLDKDIVLDGFFQSEKYFNESLVREIFDMEGDWTEKIREKFSPQLKLNPISINVRRGDYLQYPKQHPVCEYSYFRDAIEMFGKNNFFLITSDDISWCKRKFKGDNFYFAENLNASEGLLLQYLCNNNIISNSTYSWWGAWLNNTVDKKVVTPSPWFGISYKEFGVGDLVPGGWLVIKRKIGLDVYFKKSYLNVIFSNFIKVFLFKLGNQ